MSVLLRHLPQDSRLKSKINGDQTGQRWSTEAHLLSQIHELLQLMRREQLMVAGVKRHVLPSFVRLPRPGDVDHKKLRREDSVENQAARALLERLKTHGLDDLVASKEEVGS